MERNIRLTNPTGRNTQAHVLTLGGFELYFSYETLIGAFIPGQGYERIKNLWGPTTGRHFRELGLADAPITGNSPEMFAASVYERLQTSLMVEGQMKINQEMAEAARA